MGKKTTSNWESDGKKFEKEEVIYDDGTKKSTTWEVKGQNVITGKNRVIRSQSTERPKK